MQPFFRLRYIYIRSRSALDSADNNTVASGESMQEIVPSNFDIYSMQRSPRQFIAYFRHYLQWWQVASLNITGARLFWNYQNRLIKLGTGNRRNYNKGTALQECKRRCFQGLRSTAWLLIETALKRLLYDNAGCRCTTFFGRFCLFDYGN